MALAVLPFPSTIQDITATWLSAVLAQTVLSITQTEAIRGTADKILSTIQFSDIDLADKQRLRIRVKGCFNLNLVKLLPPLKDLCRVEAQFFHYLAPSLHHMSLPKCWGTQYDSEEGIVVMENLRDRGHTFGELTEVWPIERVKDGVAQLAALHASTWSKTREDYPWMTPYEQTINKMFKAEGVDYNQLARDSARYKLPSEYRNGVRVLAMLNKYYARPSSRFKCIVHGDPHVGNTCIFSRDTVSFIDWQMVDSRSCFHDVSYFIPSALSPEDRRTHEMEILDHYLERLFFFGGPQLSRDDEEVLLEFKLGYLIGMGWTVTTVAMQSIDRINAHLERIMAALVDHEVMDLVEGVEDARF